MKFCILSILLFFTFPAFAATCYINEYAGTSVDSNGKVISAAMEDGTPIEQAIAVTTSTQSAAFHATTRLVRIKCDEKTFFEFGTNPTAATDEDNSYLSTDVAEYFTVPAGQSLKVAFIEAA